MIAHVKIKAEKKHSVQYEAVDQLSKNVVSSIYIMKEGLIQEFNGKWPQELKVETLKVN